jgi:PAS domain S-box-containing protein
MTDQSKTKIELINELDQLRQRVIELETVLARWQGEDRWREDEAGPNRQSRLLEQIQAAARIGAWELDLITNSLYWTDEIYRIHETSAAEYTPALETAVVFYTLESFSMLWAALNRAKSLGQGWDLELELITAKGRRIPVRATGRVQRENGRPVKIYGTIQDISGYKRVETILRQSEEKYRNLVEYSLQGIIILQHNRIVFANPAICQMLGYSADALFSLAGEQILALIHPEDQAALLAWIEARFHQRPGPQRLEYRIVRADGSVHWLESFANPIEYEGEPALLSTSIDITQRQKLEEQFRQAQKMEAVGRLAGGIAHDFNNILTVIIGNCAFMLEGLGEEHPLYHDLEQTQRAAERAARLIRQLLAFSRQQLLRPEILNLNSIVAHVEKLLRRLIGEDIELATVLDPNLGQIKADPGQIEQVIMNLAVNARDAMRDGGKLTIETVNVYLDEVYARQHVNVKSGPHVMLVVSDTGAGMDANTLAHIFEPFFTTKNEGQGTGLGLAIVHGIISQSGGHIWVYSEPENGTIFKIYLPEIKQGDAVEQVEPVSPRLSQSSGTILLVEDETTVRIIAGRVLREQGYQVLEARNGPDALQLSATFDGPIDLLLTDVVMPGGVSGRQLAEELTSLRPGLKILYTSGYTHNVIVHHGVLGPNTTFLQKPFTPEMLSRKVREMLEG